jgi:hypothetical protein
LAWNALAVDRRDADLLKMTNDRDTGTIWFLYKERLTTRQELQGKPDRLQRHGWIDRTSQDRWLITDAGREALSAVRNWVTSDTGTTASNCSIDIIPSF